MAVNFIYIFHINRRTPKQLRVVHKKTAQLTKEFTIHSLSLDMFLIAWTSGFSKISYIQSDPLSKGENYFRFFLSSFLISAFKYNLQCTYYINLSIQVHYFKISTHKVSNGLRSCLQVEASNPKI